MNLPPVLQIFQALPHRQCGFWYAREYTNAWFSSQLLLHPMQVSGHSTNHLHEVYYTWSTQKAWVPRYQVGRSKLTRTRSNPAEKKSLEIEFAKIHEQGSR